MAKSKGKSISSLYLDLGLDVSQLDSDFINASNTVNQEMSKLGRLVQTTKLKTAIEISGLDENTNQIDILKTKLGGLSKELQLQDEKIKLLNVQEKELLQTKAKDSAESQNLTNRILREQRVQAELAQEIKRTTQAIKQQTQVKQQASTSQSLSNISQQQKNVALKADIKINGLDESTQQIDILKTKLNSLKQQLSLQKQAILMLNNEYKNLTRTEGETSNATVIMRTRLLEAQRAEQSLTSQVARVNTSLLQQSTVMNQTSSNANRINFSNITNQLSNIPNAGGSLLGFLGKANTAMLAFTATAVTLGGLSSFTDSAVKAGNSAYMLANRLNLSTAEAGNLNKVLGMADIDAKTFTSTMIRLDKSVQTAGEKGNATTEALNKFKVELKNSDGSLKNYSQQLEELAKGYQNASKAGEEEAYTAEVLGARGAELIPVLQQYTELQQSASKVKSIGIDPKMAHEATLNMKTLNMQAGQLKNALGSALMPIVNAVAPKLIEQMGDIAEFIADHQEEVKQLAEVIGNILVGALNLTEAVAKACLAPFRGWYLIFEAITGDAEWLAHLCQTINETVENYRRNGLMGVQNADAFHEQLEAEKRLEEVEKNRIKQQKELTAENEKQNAELEKQAEKQKEAYKKINKVKADLDAEDYRRSHSTLESKLYDINREMTEAIQAEEDVATATEIAELKRVSAIKQYSEEVQKNTEELNNAIYTETHSSLENRLKDIEKERKAWIEKTNDEVKATQLAEQKKRQAINQAVIDAIKSNQESIKAVQKYQDAIKNIQTSKMSIDGKDVSKDFIDSQMKKARQNLADELKNISLKKLGLKEEDLQINASVALNAGELQKQFDNNIFNIANGNLRIENTAVFDSLTTSINSLNNNISTIPQSINSIPNTITTQQINQQTADYSNILSGIPNVLERIANSVANIAELATGNINQAVSKVNSSDTQIKQDNINVEYAPNNTVTIAGITVNIQQQNQQNKEDLFNEVVKKFRTEFEQAFRIACKGM